MLQFRHVHPLSAVALKDASTSTSMGGAKNGVRSSYGAGLGLPESEVDEGYSPRELGAGGRTYFSDFSGVLGDQTSMDEEGV